MLLSYAWLQTYLPKLPSPEKLVDVLMLHGLDVEGVEDTGGHFDRVVVGEIVGIRPHPNAQKLRLADVVIEPHGEPQEIVCGAPNIEVGQKVPVALIGAKLPNGLTIASRAIRGVTSNGMLCARDELGLGSDHAGILVLDPKVKIGTPVADALDLQRDVVIDVTTPANRADLVSMRGLAWEIGAMLGQKAKLKSPTLVEADAEASSSVAVHVEDHHLSPFYTVRVIRGLTMKESPVWLQQRLQAAGMRSINTMVDVTNYIMLEYGQPLHAFDAKTISGTTMQVRAAKAGESLTTLDGKERTLDPSMIVIADGRGPVALAGVMGGEATEVSAQTTDIYLESAIFNPVSIRKTSRAVGLVSEASKRFEKGLWPAVAQQASDAAAALLVELCGGSVERGTVTAGEIPSSRRDVALDPAYIGQRLGKKVLSTTCKKILTTLGFAVTGTTRSWTVTVPEWRPDVSIAEDIVDEVGRMVGYEELPKDMPAADGAKDVPPAIRLKEEIRNILVEMGFTEVISHAFNSGRREQGEHFSVANPLDETQHVLRRSIYSQIFDVLKRQADAGLDAHVFEIGRVFDPALVGDISEQQPWILTLGATHKTVALLTEQIETFQQRLQTSVKPKVFTHIEKVRGRTIEIVEFDLQALMADAKWELPQWDPLKYVTTGVRHREQSKFPAVKRDIAFWWTKDETAISAAITSVTSDILRGFDITDRFEKDGRTSYKVSLTYQSPERTLTKAEVDDLERGIKAALISAGAEIR